VALLAEYARRVVRLFLKVSHRDEAQKTDPWGGFRIAPERVAQQLVAAAPNVLDLDVEAQRRELAELVRHWMLEPPLEIAGIAELAALFRLETEDAELFMMAAAPAIDPAISELYAFVWDNIHKKCADVGFLCQVLAAGDSERFERLLRRMSFDAPLRRHRLLVVEARLGSDDNLDKNLLIRRVRAADRVIDFLREEATEVAPVDEALSATCSRLREAVSLETLKLPAVSRDAIVQISRSKNFPVLLEGPEDHGKLQVAQALATLLDRGLVSADLTALLALEPETLQVRLSELLREARLGQDLLYFRGHDLPDTLTGPMSLVLHQMLQRDQLLLGVDRMTVWLSSVSAGWPVVHIPMPAASDRAELWRGAFEGEKRPPTDDAIDVIARRYEMSAAQIRQAAGEAKRLAQVARRRRIELNDIDRACRTYFAHKLSDLADLVPPAAFKPEQLILPANEKEKFEEVMLYAHEHDVIYGEWGFGERFPYGRGLSVLFYGPPGTGKTMAACIIASVLGLDLFRVDLSRIMNRYVGETEKNLARVFDEAERGRVMLLFDEADALFSKRTEVRSSVDKYANLEVAYLLQRMENFEGVTVLTTNAEANLDDAFKRRIRYRVYFPMPDALTRGELWRSLIPASAPVAEGIPFELLGQHFEISGGHIKQAVLRSAFYARRANSAINLQHMVDAAVAECRELGMLMSDRLPKPLVKALRRERGEPDLPEEEEKGAAETAMLGLKPMLPS
jgi:SpoVK/Ycf46/Vps4 family AAA+-type ATPase